MNRLIQILMRLAGVGIISGAIGYVMTSHEQLTKGHWLHMPSLIFIGAALCGVMLSSYQGSKLAQLARTLIGHSPTKIESQLDKMNGRLRSLSEAYYRGGAAALGDVTRTDELPGVWRKVLGYMEARIPTRDIRELVRYDAATYEDEMNTQLHVLTTLSQLAPSIGLLGTVLGLIRMLAGLDDVATLGPHMSLALVTTLYGIFFSSVVFSPLTARLRTIRDLNMKGFQQALFWVHLVENRKPAFYCEAEPAREGA